jgi:hypothetical protein
MRPFRVRGVTRTLVLLLVLLTFLVGLPFAMGMADMDSCPTCSEGDALAAVTMCLAIVLLFVLVVSFRGGLIAGRRQILRLLLLADPLERPPRLA